jgi:DNA-binding NarL/FixJ family response regulator
VRPRPGGAGGVSALTAREQQVAALIGRGYTNRQIAAALVITEGTARIHVAHVLAKLGFHTRAQAAAWAVAQGLVPSREPPAATP